MAENASCTFQSKKHLDDDDDDDDVVVVVVVVVVVAVVVLVCFGFFVSVYLGGFFWSFGGACGD